MIRALPDAGNCRNGQQCILNSFPRSAFDVYQNQTLSAGLGTEGFRCAVGNYLSSVDDQYPVACGFYFRKNVCRQDDGFVDTKAFDEVANFDSLIWIQSGCRFIKDQD